MHRSTQAAVTLVVPLLISACNHDSSQTQQHTEENGTAATITAATSTMVSAETASIIDTVNSVATAQPLELVPAAPVITTVPCATLGYGGDGTITARGALLNPGDRMEITFDGCTLADAPIAGTVGATLDERFRNDDSEGYATTFRYQGFIIGAAANASTIDGTIQLQGRYDYQTGTMTTTRSSSSLQLARGELTAEVTALECVDSYTGLWDTAPFTMECNLTYRSSALGGTVNATTTEPFRGVGGENRPTSGELLIRGANGSKTLVTAQDDGEHVLIKWDEDGDDIYEGQVRRTWDELKQDILEWKI